MIAGGRRAEVSCWTRKRSSIHPVRGIVQYKEASFAIQPISHLTPHPPHLISALPRLIYSSQFEIAKMVNVPKVKLNNGTEMPLVGLVPPLLEFGLVG